ncbi:MAG TPA: DUF6159 family protein [Phycisphaerales bacterium]|nr:DUF6159 family protein [Phycisphaerales bacterium]
MFTKLSNSWELTKQSWGVLRADKHLMVFPLVSSILTTLVCISFFVPAIILMAPLMAASGAQSTKDLPIEMQVLGFAAMFVLYFVINSIVVFFNAALIACATARFNGEDSSARAGLKAALRRWPQILGWAAVNATVGVALQMLKEKAGWLGRIVLGLVGTAWNVATFFVVPALVIEGVGPIKGVKRSFEVMRKTWGESLVTQVGVSAAMGLIGMLIFLPMLLGGIALIAAADQVVLGVVVIGLGLLALLLLSLVGSTLKTILQAACYRMATTGLVPEGFEGSSLKGMFGRKG